ncbi:MAG: AraC family transcriptional regulator [Sulfurimonas sp.]
MNKTIAEELFDKYDFIENQGLKPTAIPNVNLLKINRCEHSRELLYNRGIFLIASGQNIGYLDDKHVTLGGDQYVIIATAQPAECEQMMCTEVMKGVYLDLDLQRLQKIGSLIDKEFPQHSSKTPKNVVSGYMNDEITSAFNRLMKALLDPQEAAVLGEHLLDEIYYRIIQTTTGEHLLQLCCQLTYFSRIASVVDEIQNRLDQEISIDDMAAKAKMHRSNFHKKFKEIYNDSPIQYIKKIKLNKAREYIQARNMKVIDAAAKVGYVSPAQFSREFKHHFGFPPSELKT